MIRVENEKCVVLLESLLGKEEERRNIWIRDPEQILQTNSSAEVSSVLRAVDEAVMAGMTAVGFLSYEAGYHFLPGMPEAKANPFPLAWFALTGKPETKVPPHFFEADTETEPTTEDLALDTTREEYARSLQSIRNHIERGNTYQVNFTMRYRGAFSGSPRLLYQQLRRKQRVDYAAYIETADWIVLSLSPELFFRKKGNRIFMRPMKGTSHRGRTPEEDAFLSNQLSGSEKERAENLMIVDLLRNDLGKICESGSIHVTRPLVVERYDTVLQMTSEIEGTLLRDVTLLDSMRAMFPSGSVTGAPKVRTMQIIHELEKSPRRIYTGCIGFVSSEEATFSVAIRTAVVERNILEMGVGSGVLYEANAEREYEECRIKGRFLTDPAIDFDLIETILWLPESHYSRLSLHLDRLIRSAGYFLIPIDRAGIERFLMDNSPETNLPQRVRLLIGRDGVPGLNVTDVEPVSSTRIRWSKSTTNSDDRFLYHKTTHRPLYQKELLKAREEGFFEVIFRNERNEVTEGAFSNLWILKNGMYFTPPNSSGLLDGTYRRHLLSSPDFPAEERVLHAKDVEEADAVFISNAIRGLLKVSF